MPPSSPASTAAVARAEMLIRKPVDEVFEAIVNPEITSRYWFTASSGRLEEGAQVRWEWDMVDASVEATVKAIDKDRRVLVEWLADGEPTPIEWLFSARADDTTYVTVTNLGFQGDDDQIVRQAIDSTEGFTLMLCGLKTLLEHGIELHLSADRHPD